MTKEQLLQKLKELEEAEKQEQDKKRREKNYEEFKNRKHDWVIGLAHADIGLYQDEWNEWRKQTYSLGNCISIHGNCGTSYIPQADVTSATYTFFHNVWTDTQREQFQEKLNKLALKEIQKIMSNLTCTLELLGLQQSSTEYYISHLYPEDKADEIRNEVWKETCKVLDKHKDSEFKKLLKKGNWVDMETGKRQINYMDLCHSKSILKRYIKEHRKNLLKFFKPVFDNETD